MMSISPLLSDVHDSFKLIDHKLSLHQLEGLVLRLLSQYFVRVSSPQILVSPAPHTGRLHLHMQSSLVEQRPTL
jgi:hypothetical protein